MMGVDSRWNRRKKCNARFSEAARRGGFSVSRLKLSFGRGGRAQMFGKTVYAEYGRTAAIVVCACLFVGRNRELCENGRTDPRVARGRLRRQRSPLSIKR